MKISTSFHVYLLKCAVIWQHQKYIMTEFSAVFLNVRLSGEHKNVEQIVDG